MLDMKDISYLIAQAYSIEKEVVILRQAIGDLLDTLEYIEDSCSNAEYTEQDEEERPF